MKNRYRIIPRTEKNGDAILILPDLTANRGNVSFYVRMGEHGECDINYHRWHTKKPNGEAMALAQWYIKNKCDESDNPVIMKRLSR